MKLLIKFLFVLVCVHNVYAQESAPPAAATCVLAGAQACAGAVNSWHYRCAIAKERVQEAVAAKATGDSLIGAGGSTTISADAADGSSLQVAGSTTAAGSATAKSSYTKCLSTLALARTTVSEGFAGASAEAQVCQTNEDHSIHSAGSAAIAALGPENEGINFAISKQEEICRNALNEVTGISLSTMTMIAAGAAIAGGVVGSQLSKNKAGGSKSQGDTMACPAGQYLNSQSVCVTGSEAEMGIGMTATSLSTANEGGSGPKKGSTVNSSDLSVDPNTGLPINVSTSDKSSLIF